MKKLALIAAVCASLALASTAGASPAPRHPAPLQSTNVTATSTVQGWESRPVTGTVYVHVYGPGGRVFEQVAAAMCSAIYHGGSAIVRVRLERCKSPKAQPVALRYVSVGRPVRLRVVLTR